MSTELDSAVRMFEEIEKMRRGCEARLTHLAKNQLCLDCGKEWMPKRFEPCPKCQSRKSKLMKEQRKCEECQHIWKPSLMGVCSWCLSPNSRDKPKEDKYIELTALPFLKGGEKKFEAELIKMIEGHCTWPWVEQVKGVGPTTIGRLIGKTDIHRVETVSEMWAHCGFGLNADGTPQRKHAREKLNYDAHLQSNCVMLGESLMRQKDSYYEFYLSQKKLHSELTPAHCHNRAFRHMIKLFLSHFWETWRIAEGLPAPAPYAFGILKHPAGHLIAPEAMVKQPVRTR